MIRTAVVVFNLGGPDGPGAVKPFLLNLFMDKAVINLPWLLRWPAARFIAGRRAPVARASYDAIGGASPILENTKAQAAELEKALEGDGAGGEEDIRVFTAMRHWHPLPEAVAADVARFAPDRVILLPLYPQYSTTTTGSFMTAWSRAAAGAGLTAPTTALCCYPDEAGFIAALARLTRAAINEAAPFGRPRVLFSAHGLPQSVIARGDPYQAQVERTVVAVLEALAPDEEQDGEQDGVKGGEGGEFDPVTCYQSRVGPAAWIGPYTDAEIVRAGAEGAPVVVVPTAFVCEHSETLVELDKDYGRLARDAGTPAYIRAPTVGTAPEFIAGLARLVRRALAADGAADASMICGAVAGDADGSRHCPAGLGACPLTGQGTSQETES